ncbi:MAG TPA: DNA recombination protein RmuC [Candidatus Kaiserbacteria bacterium]|nr:DNA recombination protein RmuC [Candidatus Kaiserbacteria bacterium]
MNTTTIVFLILLLVIVQIAAFWFIAKRNFSMRETEVPEEDNEQKENGMMMIQQQLQDLSRTIDKRVENSSKQMQESVHHQLSESTRIIREVTQGLTKLDETNRQVVSFADQLKNLQDILKNPKQRGILGEYYLETMLKNTLAPDNYKMQYAFSNGEIVDAVVFIDKRIVPIDSKFSLENYNREIEAHDDIDKERFAKAFKQDLKTRIDETAKYVRPEEGTMEFAFMFIPSEGVYYDLLVNQVGALKSSTRDLIQYAFDKKVIIVSPTSFHAYLQTVMQGLKALQIEKKAEEIKKRVGELGKHIGAYEEYYRKLGATLGTTVSHYNSGYKELGKIDKDVYRITDERAGIESQALDKPKME